MRSLKNHNTSYWSLQHFWKFFGTENYVTFKRFESKRNNNLISDLPK